MISPTLLEMNQKKKQKAEDLEAARGPSVSSLSPYLEPEAWGLKPQDHSSSAFSFRLCSMTFWAMLGGTVS